MSHAHLSVVPKAQPEAFSVSLRDMIAALSLALDAIDDNSISQHRMMAYIATRIALRMGLSRGAIRNLFLAALVYGVGAVGRGGRADDASSPERRVTEAVIGARQLEILPQLREPAAIIRYHVLTWRESQRLAASGVRVPVESSILHMAAWITAHLGQPENVLAAVPALDIAVKDLRGFGLNPAVVDAYLSLSPLEGFWLDLYSSRLERILSRFNLSDELLGPEDIERLAWIFSLIIDSRSRFTANHSSGVSAAAVGLARAVGFSRELLSPVRVAGLLHDIGKLTVSNVILDKRGSLDTGEWATIKAHTFHTNRILEVVGGFEDVTRWAGDHHEALDGSGYPFHKHADDIPAGSRILAIADIFTALTEDRPYRTGMKQDEVAVILRKNAAKGALDQAIAECLLDNYAAIDGDRAANQLRQTREVNAFWQGAHEEARQIDAAIA